ncbi:hypothetical protein ABE28_003145 [Peribacillus muralis]|uniref:Uncharacterized protein n=1 Tax=Peribacillus muralis TaxID=264697 RepID=A0A1B3XJD8_9BACI|nr:hypothetical protein [Peribacillus muralis]AOH53335.1 hypothetical protein ABE28_003145 [Peribacillus muralis]
MQVTVKAHFNKQTKDSKKELVQFYVKGEDEKKQELNQLTREVVELEIEGVEQKLRCEFNKSTKDSKKTVLEFIVKGDASAENTFNFYKKAGSDVTLCIVESQMSMDDFNEETHDGIEYEIGKDGTASVSPNQMTLDDVAQEEDSEGQGQGEPDKKDEDNDDPFAQSDFTGEDDDLLD